MSADELAERLHRPDLTLSARYRRADLIRPQETSMPDQYRIDLERRDAGDWIAALSGSPLDARIVEGDGPGAVLETVGQELDQREAERLTRELRGETGPLTIEDAVERALIADVATVVEILERGGPGYAMPTTQIALAAGFVDPPGKPLAPLRSRDERVTEAAARARRALERAVRDGVIVRLKTGVELWRLASDDEVESGARS